MLVIVIVIVKGGFKDLLVFQIGGETVVKLECGVTEDHFPVTYSMLCICVTYRIVCSRVLVIQIFILLDFD